MSPQSASKPAEPSSQAPVTPAPPSSNGTAAPARQAAPAESEPTRQARELTARAKERFDAGDFGVALVEFSRAYELLQGDARRAELLNNIAVCHERMFRYDLALHYYERYLREGASDPADRAEVAAVIRGLRGLLGTLRITSNVQGEIWIDDRPFGGLTREILVPAGPHTVEIRAHAHEPARQEVRVIPRSAQALHFQLEPLPQYHGIHRGYFWTGVGLTAATLITGGALGLRALGEEKQAQELARDKVATVPDERRYENLALACDVMLGAAALFAASSAVLFFVTDWSRKPEREARPPARGAPISLVPAVTPTSLALGVRGDLR